MPAALSNARRAAIDLEGEQFFEKEQRQCLVKPHGGAFEHLQADDFENGFEQQRLPSE